MEETLYTDLQLLDRLRADDTVCFEALFDRHWRMVYMYAIRKLQSREDARNVVSAVFTELWEERYAIPVDQSLPVLLYQKVRQAVVHCLQQRLRSLSENDWAGAGMYPWGPGGAVPEPAVSGYDEKPPSGRQWFGQWLKMPHNNWNKPWALPGKNH